MRFSEYQRRSRETAVYPHLGENLVYPALGLCGEAGETAEKVKKAIRDDGGVLTDERREAYRQHFSTVFSDFFLFDRMLGLTPPDLADRVREYLTQLHLLWYVAQLATEAGLELEELAEANLEKLASRRRRSVLHGSGDTR